MQVFSPNSQCQVSLLNHLTYISSVVVRPFIVQSSLAKMFNQLELIFTGMIHGK